MSDQYLPLDHPGLPDEYTRPAHHLPRLAKGPTPMQTFCMVMIVIGCWIGVNYILTLIELRGTRDQIYAMTEEAITTQQEVCCVEIVQGIKVEHCVKTIAR